MKHTRTSILHRISRGNRLSTGHSLGVLISCIIVFCPLSMTAQSYTYMTEDFESDAWSVAGSTVTSSTGQWTTNKNVYSSDYAYNGTYSLFMSNKNGLVMPELEEGAGTLIYYAYDTNRQVYVEISSDNETWTQVEAYKESTDWTKHVVTINDASAKYLRIYTTSNKNFYIDDLLLTKTDGTDGEGNVIVTNISVPYFTQTFEDTSTYPQSKDDVTTEVTYNVDDQGEWIFLNAYKSSNESYITDGSTYDLRMLKNSSYVITPVLAQGAVSLSFNEGRRDRTLSVYTSTDEGETWELFKEVETDTENEVSINDTSVNRIKIANEAGSDADVDNICVTAYPEGTPATMQTNDITNITSSTADVSGEIVSTGDKKLSDWGICWSTDTEEPTVNDNIVSATDSAFTVTISGISAETTVWCRAYGLGLAGAGYGETKNFTTLDATLAVVETDDIIADDFEDETYVYVIAGGEISDYGGTDATEVGVCYSTSENPDTTDTHVTTYILNDNFSVSIPLEQSTTYYFRAYVVNSVGVAYGSQKTYTTGEIIIPEYEHNVYYCDPDGDDDTADGSQENPFYSLQMAADRVTAGDTIYMNAGTYYYGERVNLRIVGAANSGRIALFAKDGRAILDFSEMEVDDNNQGIRLTGSYWHMKGLDICGAGDNGLLIERNKPSGGGYEECKDSVTLGHDNIVENCAFYRNQDTGLQMKNLAAYNRVINCDSYFNADPDAGDADGFAVKISHGTGNYFYGCRAWRNSDDGWDQYIKSDGGFPDDITTTLEYCWAFDNGYLEDGSVSGGNGNGFKMGSNAGRNNVILNRCLAFNNLQKGFDQNHNTGNMILNNCTGYSEKYTDNKSHYTYRLDEDVASGHEIRLTNCVAISDGISDRTESEYAPYSISGTLVTCEMNTLPDDYKSIDPTGTDDERDDDYSLPALDFMRIADGNSKLIDTGTEVNPYDGESRYAEGILFNGLAPDLGCFETDGSTTKINVALSNKTKENISLCTTKSGLLLLTLYNATSTEEYKLCLYDVGGKLLYTKIFNGSNTTIPLTGLTKGMIMLKVTGEGVCEAAKILIK